MLALFTITANGNNSNQDPKENQKTKVVEYTCPMHPDVISDKPGNCPKCEMELVKKGPVKIEYTCPMHPEVISNNLGKCPKCGMKLVRKDSKKKAMMKGCGTMNM